MGWEGLVDLRIIHFLALSEGDSQSEAVPRSGPIAQPEERFVRGIPVGWRRGERGGNRGLVPPIVLPDR